MRSCGHGGKSPLQAHVDPLKSRKATRTAAGFRRPIDDIYPIRGQLSLECGRKGEKDFFFTASKTNRGRRMECDGRKQPDGRQHPGATTRAFRTGCETALLLFDRDRRTAPATPEETDGRPRCLDPGDRVGNCLRLEITLHSK